jgi:hypothetical protein
MRRNMVWTVLCIIFTIALFGCGGGSSGDSAPDTMTLTISGQSGIVTKSFTEGSYNSQGNLDPLLISFVTASNGTGIQLHSGVPNTQGSMGLGIMVYANTPGSYQTGGTMPWGYIDYGIFDPQYEGYSSVISSAIGTVTLSSIGNNVGEKITGSLDVVATHLTNTSNTVRIAGTFSVTRDH